MHIVALGYPTEPTYAHKKAAKEFYESLKSLIPCPICKEHYIIHVEKYPITPHLDRKADLFRWTILLHNEVNKILKKPIFTETQAIAYYSRIGQRSRSPIWNPKDFVEADYKFFLKGLGIGVAATATTVGILWYVNSS